jgi:hypothetical protein
MSTTRYMPRLPVCSPTSPGSGGNGGGEVIDLLRQILGAINSFAPSAAVTALPPWDFAPVNSIAFDAAGDITIPAIGVESTIFTFTVPRGFNGVIKTIANVFIGGGFNDGSGAIVWRILQNNQAVRGKENIINSLGTVQQPSAVGGGGFIRILENDIIAMTVLNVSIVVAGQVIAGRLSGWFYPKDEDPSGIWF